MHLKDNRLTVDLFVDGSTYESNSKAFNGSADGFVTNSVNNSIAINYSQLSKYQQY